ncbi:hypothetical protein HKCCE2091_19320 [Rhodobacterales bacterium HKCCE2091]|nr:hypothetical protein [Rhodobacterales bacterium HKCCE2091]
MTPETRKAEGASAKIWRQGPDWDGAPAAAIGAFRCDSAGSGTALLSAIVAELAAEGVTRILGPMDGDTWHSYRLVSESDGSPPFLMEPTSAPDALAAWEGAGFAPVSRYFSARAAVASGIGAAPRPVPGLVVRPWDGTAPQTQFAHVHALSVRAFAGNAFYVPIGLDDFLAMYMPFVPMLRKELIFLAEIDGELQGFLFGIPNYAEGPGSKTVILKTYAGLVPGIGHHLVHAFDLAARDLGFETVIHALIHDDNRSAERSRQHGGEIFRRYLLMGRRPE